MSGSSITVPIEESSDEDTHSIIGSIREPPPTAELEVIRARLKPTNKYSKQIVIPRKEAHSWRKTLAYHLAAHRRNLYSIENPNTERYRKERDEADKENVELKDKIKRRDQELTTIKGLLEKANAELITYHNDCGEKEVRIENLEKEKEELGLKLSLEEQNVTNLRTTLKGVERRRDETEADLRRQILQSRQKSADLQQQLDRQKIEETLTSSPPHIPPPSTPPPTFAPAPPASPIPPSPAKRKPTESTQLESADLKIQRLSGEITTEKARWEEADSLVKTLQQQIQENKDLYRQEKDELEIRLKEAKQDARNAAVTAQNLRKRLDTWQQVAESLTETKGISPDQLERRVRTLADEKDGWLKQHNSAAESNAELLVKISQYDRQLTAWEQTAHLVNAGSQGELLVFLERLKTQADLGKWRKVLENVGVTPKANPSELLAQYEWLVNSFFALEPAYLSLKTELTRKANKLVDTEEEKNKALEEIEHLKIQLQDKTSRKRPRVNYWREEPGTLLIEYFNQLPKAKRPRTDGDKAAFGRDTFDFNRSVTALQNGYPPAETS
jgi:chromosome segregation ATPase